MVPVLSKKIPNKQKSKTKAFPEKTKLPICFSYSHVMAISSNQWCCTLLCCFVIKIQLQLTT